MGAEPNLRAPRQVPFRGTPLRPRSSWTSTARSCGRRARASKLQLQPFRVLALLASQPGRLLTREEIQREVWSDGTFVDFEQALNFCIRQIRCALGDQARDAALDRDAAPPGLSVHRRGRRRSRRRERRRAARRTPVPLPGAAAARSRIPIVASSRACTRWTRSWLETALRAPARALDGRPRHRVGAATTDRPGCARRGAHAPAFHRLTFGSAGFLGRPLARLAATSSTAPPGKGKLPRCSRCAPRA